MLGFPAPNKPGAKNLWQNFGCSIVRSSLLKTSSLSHCPSPRNVRLVRNPGDFCVRCQCSWTTQVSYHHMDLLIVFLPFDLLPHIHLLQLLIMAWASSTPIFTLAGCLEVPHPVLLVGNPLKVLASLFGRCQGQRNWCRLFLAAWQHAGKGVGMQNWK